MVLKKDKFKKSLLSGKILDFKMNKKKSIDINVYKDFDKVKKILKKNEKNN
jgi:CMP-N-acetylneuraminic acid synthetase